MAAQAPSAAASMAVQSAVASGMGSVTESAGTSCASTSASSWASPSRPVLLEQPAAVAVLLAAGFGGWWVLRTVGRARHGSSGGR